MPELKQTISALVGLQNVINVSSVTSTAIIIVYLKTKPPGAQTVLDLIALDTCYTQIGTLTIWEGIVNLGYFNGQADYQAAEGLIATGVFVLEWMIANCQCYIMVNAVLIFKPEWINDTSDEQVMRITRTLAVTYSLAAKWLDTLIPQNPIALDYMTGIDQES